jgi:hypothetical protein
MSDYIRQVVKRQIQFAVGDVIEHCMSAMGSTTSISNVEEFAEGQDVLIPKVEQELGQVVVVSTGAVNSHDKVRNCPTVSVAGDFVAGRQ